MSSAAIVLAGGAGTRLQASENKAYLSVGGRPLLAWSLAAFDAAESIAQVVLVIRAEDAERAEALLAEHPVGKLAAVVVGGTTRHASERAGLEVLAGDVDAGVVDLVCIHDAARPFVRSSLLERVLAAARRHGGAIPGLAVDAPVLLRTGSGGGAAEPVATDDLRRVQTPQAFRGPELLAAFRRAEVAGFAGVDTAETVARFSALDVHVVEGDRDNIKVTFVEDLFAVEALAARWSG